MIKEIQSCQELINEIKYDKVDKTTFAQRYPIRFIFLNNIYTQKGIIEDLSQRFEMIELSKYLPHDDGWLTMDKIISVVKATVKDSIIISLSEILRFMQPIAFNTLLVSLCEIENTNEYSSKRIYIPMLGMWNRFKKEFYDNFHRKNEGLILWKVSESEYKKINILQNNNKIESNIVTINSTKDWLNLWKNINEIDTILSRSKSLGYLYKEFLPDNTFSMAEVSNTKDLIKLIFSIEIPFEYKDKESIFWDKLLKYLNPSITFKQFINRHFNKNNFSSLNFKEIIYTLYNNQEQFDLWLIVNYTLNNKSFSNTYLHKVLFQVKKYNFREIEELLWKTIYDYSPSEEHFNDRKIILNILYRKLNKSISISEDEIESNFDLLKEMPVQEKMKYLTDITFAERKYIIKIIQESRDFYFIMSIIKEIYPDIYYYFNFTSEILFPSENMWFKSYFTQYRLSKLIDKKTDELTHILLKYNNSEKSFYQWYYKIKPYSELKFESIFWIDALGLEWVSLLYKLLLENLSDEYQILKCEVRRANIPTTTNNNRFHKAIHITEFDKFIHEESPYKYPDTLIKQIDLLKKIVIKRIIPNLYNSLAIVADHGFTFLAQKKYGNFKKFDFKDSSHEYRCMAVNVNKNYRSDSNFLLHKNEGSEIKEEYSLMSLNHTSMYNTPSREVHGGATPEEILVPFIVISRTKDIQKYDVIIENTEIILNNPIISFKITPNPITPPQLNINDNYYELDFVDEKWTTKVTNLHTGYKLIKVIIGSKPFEFRVLIKSGIIEEDLF